MGLTVSNLASEYYNIYALTNSSTYTENKADASEVSEAAFGVSDMDSAFETLTKTSDTDFSSIGDVSGYVRNAFSLSQSSVFSKLEDTGSVIGDLLAGSSDTSSIYDVISEESESTASSVSDVISSYSSSASTYQTYLKENVLDTSV